jgi:hypothetical protein
MPDETHRLQKDPPEGSREVIEHELKRQAGKDRKDGSPDSAQGNSTRQERATPDPK